MVGSDHLVAEADVGSRTEEQCTVIGHAPQEDIGVCRHHLDVLERELVGRIVQARLQLAAREARDAALDELRRKYAAKLQMAQDQLRRAEARHERETEQASQQTLNAAVSIGATLLGALFGGGTRRRRSGYGGYGTVGRASTAARSASRAYSERGDVARAAETVEVERQQLAELESALQADMAEVSAGFDPTRLVLREVRLAPRKSDLAVGRVEWVWRRYRRGTDGFREPT